MFLSFPGRPVWPPLLSPTRPPPCAPVCPPASTASASCRPPRHHHSRLSLLDPLSLLLAAWPRAVPGPRFILPPFSPLLNREATGHPLLFSPRPRDTNKDETYYRLPRDLALLFVRLTGGIHHREQWNQSPCHNRSSLLVSATADRPLGQFLPGSSLYLPPQAPRLASGHHRPPEFATASMCHCAELTPPPFMPSLHSVSFAASYPCSTSSHWPPLAHAIDLVTHWPPSRRLPPYHRAGRVEPWPWAQSGLVLCDLYSIFRIPVFQFKLHKFVYDSKIHRNL
jgi:hypothetical protein